MIASLIHEAGHILFIWLSGRKIDEIRLVPGGFDIHYRNERSSYLHDIIASAAGPIANFAAAVLFSYLKLPFSNYFVGVNAILCFFNLLPVYPLDGGRILYSAMAFFSPVNGRQLFLLFSSTISIFLFSVSVIACFFNIKAFWSAFVFGIILFSQRLGYVCREVI